MRTFGVVYGMLRHAHRTGKPLGAQKEPETKKTNQGDGQRKPKLSKKCEKGDHGQCYMIMCTCPCGHPSGK